MLLDLRKGWATYDDAGEIVYFDKIATSVVKIEPGTVVSEPLTEAVFS